MPSPQNSNEWRYRNNVSDLDRTRQASMADEGGESAALMEIEDDSERRRMHHARSGLTRHRQIRVVAALGIGAVSVALGAWAIYGLTSKRSFWS
ncbi:MAG TPA: hypothetical protein VGL13_07290 [Polyangiaceae bacterium]|jgi:hypothetical protein